MQVRPELTNSAWSYQRHTNFLMQEMWEDYLAVRLEKGISDEEDELEEDELEDELEEDDE